MKTYIEKLAMLTATMMVNVSIFIFLYRLTSNLKFSVGAAWLLECVLAFTVVIAEFFPTRFPLKKTLLFWTLLFWVILIPPLCITMLAYPPLLPTFSGVFMWLSLLAVLLIYSLKEH